jgi:3-methylfumaryl-CoA hydratase
MDIAHLKSWIGRTESATDIASSVPLSGLAALLDHKTPPWIAGELPPLAHWFYFLDHARQSELGADGHPNRGGFLPPVELPRRMWAGGRIEFHSAIALGATMQRRSTIKDVTAKTGATGEMVFVTVSHKIFSGTGVAISEEQDIVFRDMPKEPPPPGRAETRTARATRRIVPDPTLLFRFSALTFNAHRIHYDRDYARNVESYPGLVVQGPLTAMLLMDHFLRERGPSRISGFTFRALRPLFDTSPFDLCMAGNDLWALNNAHEAAFTATISA